MDVVGIGRIESKGSGGGATVPARYSTRAGTVHELERQRGGGAAARAGGALGTPAAGLRPRPAREKVFPSNLLLD
jgi:hypothetical protein